MRYNFLTLIVSCIVLSSPINQTHAVEPKEQVTNEYLTVICAKTSNPPLCLDVLKGLIGSPLSNSNFATLAIRPISVAGPCAKEIHKVIEQKYRSLIDPSREVRERYQKCMVAYNQAIYYIDEAKRRIKIGDYKRVKSYLSGASKRAASCDAKFARPPPEPEALKIASKKLRDLCSIVEAIII